MKVGLVGLVLGVCCVVSCGTEPSPAPDPRKECERLREELVELQMQRVTTDHEQHRAAFRAALGDRFVDDCVAHR